MNTTLSSILQAENLDHLLTNFTDQGVTDSILAELSDSDLKDLGIDKLGERKRLLAAFKGGASTSTVVPVAAAPSGVETPVTASPAIAVTPAEATKESPFVNSLGMPFVPIPRYDTRFCIWPVRVQDYEAYCMASGAQFPPCDFPQDSYHPIVNVSWDDAIEFSVWLTGKERAEGKIAKNAVYRLPTDLEWSAAVGLPHEPEATPAERSEKVPGYPWGLRWPPPKGSGNYDQSLEVDSFEHTSPVGSFPANAFGLYDMGGNVWEWCMDWYNPSQEYRVVRGASWSNFNPELLLSSARDNHTPDLRNLSDGFRCVLVGESSR